MKRKATIVGLAAVAFSALTSFAHATTLEPTDMRGIRQSSGCAPLCLLDFSTVQSGTEDRTVAHFDLTGITTFTGATLVLPTSDSDASMPGPSFLDIYSFAGDGTVDVNEFGAGTLLAEITGITGDRPTVTLDITAKLMAAVGAGDTFLSFNLRNKSTDQGSFFLSEVIGGVFDGGPGGVGPTRIELTGVPAVPLPAGAVLLLTGAGALIALRRRRTRA